METIWDCYDFMRFAADEVRSGYVSPEEASKALGAAQQSVYDNYFRAGYGSNQTSTEALRNFQKEATGTPSSAGLLPYPENYGHLISLYRQEGAAPPVAYRQVLGNELADAIASSLVPIAKYPRYMFLADGIRLHNGGVTPSPHTIIYLRKPAQPKIDYTISGTGEPVYNPATSIQLEFPKEYWDEITREALPYIGINLSKAELAALATAKAG